MLRKATEDDFEMIYTIYMDPTVNPYMSWEVMPAKEFHPIFQEVLSSQALHVYEIDEKVVAVIRLDRKKYRLSHIAYIGRFGILASHQKQGIGLKIMKEAIAVLKSQGVKRIELIVESDNPNAIRLYEKLGFEVEGTLRNFFKRKSQDHYVNDYYMAMLVS
jgi:RimJ/RimL family protein N-acetyltransferase